jgi:hypothetical protein
VASNQTFDKLTRLSNIAFTPHTTSGATVTLNVDGLGAKPLRSAPYVELPAGTLVQGTPYVCVYNSSDSVFYLQGFFSNPYTIPIGGFLDFGGSTAPNSSFEAQREAQFPVRPRAICARARRILRGAQFRDPYSAPEQPEDDISADLEDDNPAKDGDPAENDLDDERSLGSLDQHHSQKRWAAGGRRDLEQDHAESGIADRDGLLEQAGSQDWQQGAMA